MYQIAFTAGLELNLECIQRCNIIRFGQQTENILNVLVLR